MYSAHVTTDLLVWPLTSDGSYSVKSAYRWRLKLYYPSQALPIPKQVKVCGIKSGNYMFLTELDISYGVLVANLFPQKRICRHVVPTSECNLCDEFPEDTIHGLWLCDNDKPVRFLTPSFSFLRIKTFSSFRDLMEFVLLSASSKFAALFSMIAWCVWQRRNRIREKQPTWEVVDIVKIATELL